MGEAVPTQMILRPRPVKYREWWDTDFCRDWTITGMLAGMWGRHFAPVPHFDPENDKDHIPW